jgi:hypothetical protein
VNAATDERTGPIETGFGPTLPELVRPAWRRWSAGRRAVTIGLVVLVLGGIAALVLRARGSEFRYSGPAAPAFSFRYDGMRAVPAQPGELVRLERIDNGRLVRRLVAEPVPLRPAADPISTTLPFAAQPFVESAAEDLAGYDQIAEGRTRLDIIHGKEAYMFAFTATGSGPESDGSLWVGKTFLIPEPGPRPSRAVAIELLERVRSAKVAAAVRNYPAGFLLNWPIVFWTQQRTSVDVPGELERPLKSFSFG